QHRTVMAPAVSSSSAAAPAAPAPNKPLNIGTALPYETRTAMHIKGLVPSAVEDFSAQETRALEQLKAKGTDLEKYIFLSWLRNTNIDLFYRLVIHNLKEIAPIIYTPTVGQACQEFSHIYPFLAPPNTVDGLYIPLDEVDNIDEILSNYRASVPPGCVPETTVITDGSRILGLGDLGMNGMGIPVGKLQLYVAAAGLDPARCLPIVLDFGTDNAKYRDDPLYLGLRRERPDDNEVSVDGWINSSGRFLKEALWVSGRTGYDLPLAGAGDPCAGQALLSEDLSQFQIFYAATDKVLTALSKAFPGIFIQFEDFNTPHAFGLLDRWRNSTLCFNDDIQGTGSVILAGFISAIRLAGIPAQDHRVLFVGAGSAGVGVAKQLVDYLVIEHKIPEEKAKAMFWFVDSRGMITANRGDKLAEHKIYFARHDNGSTQCKDLADTLECVKPTALIGLSTIYKAFNEKILTRMSQLNAQNRPIIFPL
ncbi:hypothetical protein GGH99_005701, partial [Coemansia sp. RSA 1285]